MWKEKKLLGGLWSLCIDIFAGDRDFPVQLFKLNSWAVFLVASLSLGERRTWGHVIYGAQIANTSAHVLHFCSVAVWCPYAEMTTDQDLPMDGQCATAVFAAKGTDVTPNKDQGVIKVLSSLFQIFILAIQAWVLRIVSPDVCVLCLVLAISVCSYLCKRFVCWTQNQSLPSSGCEVPRAGWRPADDWGQSDYPLHRETAEWKKVWLQSWP